MEQHVKTVSAPEAYELYLMIISACSARATACGAAAGATTRAGCGWAPHPEGARWPAGWAQRRTRTSRASGRASQRLGGVRCRNGGRGAHSRTLVTCRPVSNCELTFLSYKSRCVARLMKLSLHLLAFFVLGASAAPWSMWAPHTYMMISASHGGPYGTRSLFSTRAAWQKQTTY